MSYKLDTSKDSPNFTPGASSPATFGRARTIEAIAIHWWGDPNNNPTYDGIVNFLCNPNAGVSAHFVASGTNRSVAQIVNFSDVSWATNSANPYTISIECDPRCRDEDYDVIAEVIAQIRDAYGPLPLVAHRQFVATACPGNYDLGRLDAIANTKDGSGDWGTVTNKNVQPTPPPAPVYDNLYRLIIDGKQRAAYSNDKNAYNGYVYYSNTGSITFQGRDVTAELVERYKPVAPPPQVVDPPVVVVTPQPETPPKVPESPQEPSEPDSGVITQPETTTLLEDLKKWFAQLLELLSKYKRNK